jgi:hypothetical protein
VETLGTVVVTRIEKVSDVIEAILCNSCSIPEPHVLEDWLCIFKALEAALTEDMTTRYA